MKLLLCLIICIFVVYPVFAANKTISNEEGNKTINNNEEGNYTEALSEPYESPEEIMIPQSGVKRSVESQLKGTGLMFMPYAPGDAFPVEQSHIYTAEGPIIILPENKANKTEVKEGGKNNE